MTSSGYNYRNETGSHPESSIHATLIGSFQSQQVDRNSENTNGGVWDLYNPQRIAENYAVVVNNFTSYLLNTSNLINNTLASNIRVYNTALEQTRDNLKALTKKNNYIKAVDRQNREINTSDNNNNINERPTKY